MSKGARQNPQDATVVDPNALWIKSSYSGPTGGNCVEVAFFAGGDVAVRNSRHPGGPSLVFTEAEWTAFLRGAEAGQFAASD